MASDALYALEWDKLLDLAVEQARTEPGCERLDRFFEPDGDESLWAHDEEQAVRLQVETQEMAALLDREALWGVLVELRSPFDALEALEKGSVVEVERLALVRSWLYAIDSWASTPRDAFLGDHFKRDLARLMDPLELLKHLDRILTPDGQLSETATTRLGQLYAEVRGLKREISSLMERVVQKYAQKGVLQESFSDVHDGRYVVPVRIADQNAIEGAIYGTSSSRQTVFVEPAEVSPLNNRLKQKENELSQEIYAILEAAAKMLRPFVGEIADSIDLIAYWDATQAKARLARKYSGKALRISRDRNFRLKETAHPLLWWALPASSITRNDMDFGEKARTLLLTGPNTGGKTVLLKTMGVAGVCARTGFPFPGQEAQEVPFFDHFFVDVGDPQSIEQHLSSFSGHIERFKNILASITERSLVLLDELNTATDPGEGAALGRAFLETVMAKGATIVATTHDPQLKALALNDPRIVNASMAFDEASRSPTYTMVLGVPGRSRALETAERLGLPADVIRLARGYLTEEHNRFEGMLAKLEKEAADAERARKDAVRLREGAERLEREWRERTEANVSELMDRTRQKLRRILEDAQDQVRDKVRKLDELRSRKDVDSTRGGLNDSFRDAAERIETALKEEAPDIAANLAKTDADVPREKSFAAGETVRVPKWKNLATILDLPGARKARVQMGALQLTLSFDDLEKASAEETPKSAKPKSRGVQIERPSAPPSTLDLRGVRYEEAMQRVEEYIDLAFRSGSLAQVTVIHGLGSGALREGTRALLKSLPYIKAYGDAPGGGAGATLIEFD